MQYDFSSYLSGPALKDDSDFHPDYYLFILYHNNKR